MNTILDFLTAILEFVVTIFSWIWSGFCWLYENCDPYNRSKLGEAIGSILYSCFVGLGIFLYDHPVWAMPLMFLIGPGGMLLLLLWVRRYETDD